MSHNELTGREADVLQLLGKGYCNKLIARELDIGVGTVKSHLKRVMSKLNVTARTQAVVVATQRGLIGAETSTGVATGINMSLRCINSVRNVARLHA
jgi:DNA-binding CsgD family transcriptional regulator